MARGIAVNKHTVQQFFTNPAIVTDKNNFLPDRIYKMCERRVTATQCPEWNSGTTIHSSENMFSDKGVKQIRAVASAKEVNLLHSFVQ